MYLLDSNVFIQAKNHYYGFDFVPAFWDWLIKENRAGHVASIEQVEHEILAGGDELSEWAKGRGDTFFLRTDLTLIPALNKVSNWATSQGYDSAAVSTFLRVADCWLVAYALEHNCVVVTHEIPADTVKKIKIPNACLGLNIRCVNPYEMLRAQQARFVLDCTKNYIPSDGG